MKLAAYSHAGERRLGVLVEGGIVLLPPEIGQLSEVIARGAAGLAAVHAAIVGREPVAFDPGRLLAPLDRLRRDILCTGWNYWDHFEEGRGRREGQEVERPAHPTFFTKGPDVLIGPNDAIAYDGELSAKWDYEVEVALIIGRDGRNIPEEQALDHVFGYCLANDVSQRDLQRAHGGQWLKGKSIDGTMPLGPWITTADEVDPTNIDIACVLNGETMQAANTSMMAFPISRLIAEMSAGMTLRAGDLILTGTPAGVGNARTPPLFLKAGDEMLLRSSVLGEMRNRLVETDLHSPVLAIDAAAAGQAATMPRNLADAFREVLIQTGDLDWAEKSLAGLSQKMLWRDDKTGASIALIKFEKGVGVPNAHAHASNQFMYCLSGRYRYIPTGTTLVPGSFYWNPVGSVHGPTVADETTIFLEIYDGPHYPVQPPWYTDPEDAR
ncbi:fumarylacetoacetate hydrolase family protein [Devosia sp.]|uniref:fumarylacetoacetate hydrolase family protein n=1 Tax=Devosia sp. TaxID=1871048 RepID=UPI002F002037